MAMLMMTLLNLGVPSQQRRPGNRYGYCKTDLRTELPFSCVDHLTSWPEERRTHCSYSTINTAAAWATGEGGHRS